MRKNDEVEHADDIVWSYYYWAKILIIEIRTTMAQQRQVMDNTTTELQDQLHVQAAKQKIADLETQIETQKTEYQKTIADLETQIVLLSE